MIKDEARELFGTIPERANKGSMGRLLVVGGSYDQNSMAMSGAAFFAAKAAYRCGAGIVEIFTPKENYPSLSTLIPEAVFSLYSCDEPKCDVTARLAASLEKCDAVVLGCGLGKGESAREMVKLIFERVDRPMLIDADGLNIVSENESLWELLSDGQRARTVITPHPGEMSRLTGKPISVILDNVPETARNFAREKGIICLLKDHNTAVSDGERIYINQSGNAGMATAGMGDVLSGIIGALLARDAKRNATGSGREMLCAAVGAYLHGCAGDLAAERSGQYSLMASDLLAEIPTAIKKFFG